MIGKTISHYRVVEQLGAGGMGVVYKAEDLRLARHVAIKFLNHDLANDRDALERFRREARAASALNHSHICTIYDVSEHDEQSFIVMEFLEGQTVKQRLAGGNLKVDDVLDLGIQIAEALDAAHSKGILHRDLKPANIFITNRRQAKILDFGLAKLLHRSELDPATLATETATLTRPGMAVGTLTYMSPEQVRGDELDPRSDLFSFGVVLYEMATGHSPFGRESVALVFDAILHSAAPPLMRFEPRAPVELDQIVSKALEKRPELRYQHALEIAADLRRLHVRRLTVGPAAERMPPRREVRPPDDAIVSLATEILARATEQKASDIHLEPRPDGFVFRLRVDGRLRVEKTFPKEVQLDLTAHFKDLAKLDADETRLPQDGIISRQIDDKEFEFRFTTAPSKYGEKIVMRILSKAIAVLPLEKLVLDEDTLKRIRWMLAQPHGVIWVTGPTGSGKTNTVYSSLVEINSPELNISTVEDPIEFELPGITQLQVQADIGLTISRLLRTVLKQDPDVIMIGEIRDEESAKLAIEAALTGHLVLTLMHANDTFGALQRLSEAGIDAPTIAEATIGVVAQRLCRKNCEQCRAEISWGHLISQQERGALQQLGIDTSTKTDKLLRAKGQVFYRGVGCAACSQTGFKGRVALYETLCMNDELRRLVASGAKPDSIREIANRSGLKTLKDYGLYLVSSGLCTPVEVLSSLAPSS